VTHGAAQPILQRARELGFALAGVTPASPTDHDDALQDWLREGKHGEMTWLAEHTDVRTDPRRLVQQEGEVRSLILVADQYASRNDPPESASSGAGRIARYARGDDYHRVMKKRLQMLADALRADHPGHIFRCFVDTAPVLEREHAARAGLGWVGKHTLLIHPRLGSYLFLGGIATSLELTPPPQQSTIEDHCGMCTRCIDACPTDAITPYAVDATRCISYLTIEHRSPIDAQFHAAMGDWVYGCDICQEVCPHNSARPDGIDTGRAYEAYQPRQASFDLLEVLGWTEEDRREAFRRSAMKRAKLDMMRRNAVVAAGNDGGKQLFSSIEEIASDDAEPELVRRTAQDVLEGRNRAG
jgi:epoxyqueuosine reductase